MRLPIFHTHHVTRRMRFGLTAAVIATAMTACSAAPALESTTDGSGDADGTDKVLYLTFDDGPGTATGKVLRVLNENDAEATFFTIGKQVAAHPKTARRERVAGDAVAAHTWGHLNLTRLDPTELSRQLDRSIAELRDVGSDSDCVRPPYGAVDSAVKKALDKRHLRSVLWNIDPKDWRNPGAHTIADRIVGHAYSGAVVLLHDGGGDRAQTVEALRIALPRLRSEGYRLAPIPGCWSARIARCWTGTGCCPIPRRPSWTAHDQDGQALPDPARE